MPYCSASLRPDRKAHPARLAASVFTLCRGDHLVCRQPSPQRAEVVENGFLSISLALSARRAELLKESSEVEVVLEDAPYGVLNGGGRCCFIQPGFPVRTNLADSMHEILHGTLQVFLESRLGRAGHLPADLPGVLKKT